MWHVWERRDTYRILVGKMKEHHLQDLGVDGRIILNRIFKELEWEGVDWFRVVSV
jgi:hypothetical protein